MTRRIELTLDGITAGAQLHDDLAPRACELLWQDLPIEETLRHVRWSGEAGYILVSTLAKRGDKLENPVSFYPPGSIVFRPEHGEVAFTYGQAQARDHMMPAGWASHVGTIDRNADAFLARVRDTRRQGGKGIQIRWEVEQ
jgi:hypothetical protein